MGQIIEQKERRWDRRVVGSFAATPARVSAWMRTTWNCSGRDFRILRRSRLLIRPFAQKPSTAGIFIRESGSVQGEASYLEFPFRSSELAVGRDGPAPNPGTAGPKSAAPSAVCSQGSAARADRSDRTRAGKCPL